MLQAVLEYKVLKGMSKFYVVSLKLFSYHSNNINLKY